MRHSIPDEPIHPSRALSRSQAVDRHDLPPVLAAAKASGVRRLSEYQQQDSQFSVDLRAASKTQNSLNHAISTSLLSQPGSRPVRLEQIAIFAGKVGGIRGVWFFQRAGRTIATPGPPSSLAPAAIKFLPLASVILSKHRGATVHPDLFGFKGQCPTGRAAKFPGVNSSLSPVGRSRRKCIHATTLSKVGYSYPTHTCDLQRQAGN